ncbi:phospholipase effector Tle1 domain-containing protein [Rhodosalinus sp.]|uniref:phospholipase effector Tle1 domain-containing protein n=1 Tax=Rhodosalinus sp. TaxID=2047741 RepID=UPI003565E7D5
MSKNIVIFSDGTAMVAGRRPDELRSNIYKLYDAARIGPDSPIDPADQIAFYEAGLGTEEIAGPAWLRPISYLKRLLSLGLGTGLMSNVADIYKTILKYYEPGDRIFLFGFSRGAYTARCVCGVMNLCGVPTRAADGSALPRAGRALRRIAEEAVFEVHGHGAGRDRRKFEPEREELARRFRETYGAQDDPETNVRGNVVPYFVGVFDTVASLGASGAKRAAILVVAFTALAVVSLLAADLLDWLLPTDYWESFAVILVVLSLAFGIFNFKRQFRQIRDYPRTGERRWHLARWRFRDYDMFLDPRVAYARHAIALDEDRRDFQRVGWARAEDVAAAPDDWLIQTWFAGNHSDIGGGAYPEAESRLSDIALDWMVEQATSVPHPLIVRRDRLQLFPDPLGVQHCARRELLDAYPDWVPASLRFTWPREERRGVSVEACHPSIIARVTGEPVYRNGERISYRPQQLSDRSGLSHYYDEGGEDTSTG